MSSPPISTPKASRLSVAERFIAGFVVGVLALPLVGVVALIGILVANDARHETASRDPRPLVVTTAGAEITGAGGVAVVVHRTTDVVRQDCREGCDDLRIEAAAGTLDAVRVLDVKGGCVACRSVAAEPYGEAQSRTWTVAGASPLSITGDARE